MKLIHLSHTDLDGYGCQFITKYYFKDIIYFNANYGLEVESSLKSIISHTNFFNKDEEYLILITDLNLNNKEAKMIDRHIEILINNNINVKLQLLDHHKSGEELSKLYPWYYLDGSRSATKITFNFFKENFKPLDNLEDEILNLDKFVEAVNAVDIWLEDNQFFEFGKVCMKMISESREIPILFFPNENRDYKFQLLKFAKEYLNTEKENIHILLDDDFYMLKKRSLGEKIDTLDNLSSTKIVDLLENKKSDLTVHYKGFKGLLTFAIGNISILANKFLKDNSDYSFFIDVGRKGSISLRANGTVDVSKIAYELAEGGGHANASGGKFKDFKEKIFYKDIKKFIDDMLAEKEIFYRNRNIKQK